MHHQSLCHYLRVVFLCKPLIALTKMKLVHLLLHTQILFHLSRLKKKRQWMKVWLGGPTGNTLKGQSRNKHWPNNILGPFSIFFPSCLFIACQNIWLEVSITILKRWKSLQICIPYWCGLFRNQVLKLWKFITKLYLLK